MRIFLAFLMIVLGGCGYKPLAYYAKETFGKSIYVDIHIPADFPKSGVNLKDALNRAILSRLHLSLDSKEKAESILQVNLSNLSFDMISEDSEGFANHYRANVNVTFSYKSIYGADYEMTLSASSDYSATSSMTSLSIEKSQLDAINLALQQIVDQFISRIFYQSITHKKTKEIKP